MKHYIIWKIKENYSYAEKEKIKSDAKENLESLVGKVNGLKSLEIITELLPTSTGDMMLISELENAEALEFYRTHPLHVAAADKYVRPFMDIRLCCDYE